MSSVLELARLAEETRGRSEEEDEPSRLARALQAGDRTALAALYEQVRPLIRLAMRRYRNRPGGLPTMLERADLLQESWLILADLARRWRPASSFAAYFRVSFPWALARYVRQHSPSLRAKGVRVFGAERPDIQELLDTWPGADGRELDGEVRWREMLEHLSEPEQVVLLLHLAEQQPFSAVAQAMRLTRPSAYRLYRRALRRAQGSAVRVAGRTVFLRAEILNLERQGELVELVQVLHQDKRQTGQLPGREWLVAKTGLSLRRVSYLLGLLVEAGCVRGRGPRQAGQLVYAEPETTLAALGIRTES